MSKCVICEEEDGTVMIGELCGYGNNVMVCSGCYSDCEPVDGDDVE